MRKVSYKTSFLVISSCISSVSVTVSFGRCTVCGLSF